MDITQYRFIIDGVVIAGGAAVWKWYTTSQERKRKNADAETERMRSIEDGNRDSVRKLLEDQNADLKAVLASKDEIIALKEQEIAALRSRVSELEGRVGEVHTENAEIKQMVRGLAMYIRQVDPDRADIVDTFLNTNG